MHPLLQRLAADALHLIAPALCPACDTLLGLEEHHYCHACRASLEPAPFPREIFIEIAGNFPGEELALSAIGSLYTFYDRNPVQRLIHAVKYKGCYQLGIELGKELGRGLMMFREFEEVEVIIPVPLHRARLRERGYNQAEAIAEGVAAMLPGNCAPGALERGRHTVSQTTLGASERRRNIRDAFRVVGEEVRGRAVLLCDDVCTTGATLNACAERLLLAGARQVLAATVAKDNPGAARIDTGNLFSGGIMG